MAQNACLKGLLGVTSLRLAQATVACGDAAPCTFRCTSSCPQPDPGGTRMSITSSWVAGRQLATIILLIGLTDDVKKGVEVTIVLVTQEDLLDL